MTIYGRSEELVSRCVECDLAEPESLASLGGSAPGLVDGILSALYSMVHFSMFSFIICSCKSKEIISLHTIILKQNTNEATCCLQFTIEYISLHKETRYFIPITINTHIDCANNSMCSVRCMFKATARSLESVTLSIFC